LKNAVPISDFRLNIYFESDPLFEETDKRQFGYSRDKRSDCVQVNTLSAKADSFFEHPAYWRGYAQLARSRPGALKNIPSGVNVPIEHQSASALMNTNVQGLRHLRSARRAELACVVRGHLNYFTTSLRNFVSEYCDEARPCDVANRSRKSVVPWTVKLSTAILP